MLTQDLPMKSFGRYPYPPSKKQDKPLKKSGCCDPFGLEHQKTDNTAVLSKEYESHTPYNYTTNNPIRFTDVNGLYSTEK
ncbi:hypothetical protein OAC51_09760 [Flavobacteriaceae bacterium]|nr:hypothetical protein [Flavobacteriaceae bacterium]